MGTAVGVSGTLVRDEGVADSILLSLVALAALKYTLRLDAVEDVPVFSSEATYLARGVHLRDWGIVNASDSPLYSVWYYVLSLFAPDPLRLYLVSHIVLIVGATCLLF